MVETSHTLDTVRGLMTAPTTRQDLKRAHDICQALSSKAPNDPEILFLLGALTREVKGAEEAIPHLLKSVELQKHGIQSRLLLVRCLSDTRQWDAAVPHAQQALTLQTKGGRLNLDLSNVEALSILARHALYTDEWAVAASYFVNIINVLEAKVAVAKATAQAFDPSSLPPLAARQVHPILYLPVEIKAREFESKCLLALAAAEAGFNVVIGRTWVLTAGSYADLPPGIVLFKTLNAMDALNMATAQVNGSHLIAALDEEAFGRSASPRAVKLNVDPLAVQVADLILMQGQAHQETWAELFNIDTSHLTVTGNPKTDLLRHQAPATLVETKPKPVILFCTMSGNINPKGRGFARTMGHTLESASTTSSPEMMAELGGLLRDAAQFEAAMVPQIAAAVHATAAKFPDADIIVRPHPVEDPDLWKTRFGDAPNVRVETHGPLTEWLIQSDVMVYLSGCASGVEAWLHGTPAINFAGDDRAADPAFGLSSTLSKAACSASDVVTAIEVILRHGHSDISDTNLDYFIKSGEGEIVSRSVASALRALFEQHSQNGPTPLQALRDLKSVRSKSFPLTPFHLQKFPDTSAGEVRAELDSLAERFNMAKPGTVEDIEDGVFLITPLSTNG